MTINIRCDECNNFFSERSESFDDVGTLWVPQLVIDCPHCGKEIRVKLPSTTIFNKATFISEDKEGFMKLLIGNSKSFAMQGCFPEKFVQDYFCKYYSLYGFKSISGPYARGPDFKGEHNTLNGEQKIEVERNCDSYISHKHHLNVDFHGTNFLIVLENKEPPQNILKKLPENIIFIDAEHFSDWWEKHPEHNRYMTVLILIRDEFKRMFVGSCGDKNKGWNNCPTCDKCIHFTLPLNFMDIAIEFITASNLDFGSENFKIREITAGQLQEFYKNYVLNKFY